MPTIEDALALALDAHRGQVDKAGAPYILHPLRVMLSQPDDAGKIVGLLHDVVEDSDYTFADLRRMGYDETIIAALDCLTRRPDEDYMTFVERAKANPIARRVKLADIEDNLDIRRIAVLSIKDIERLPMCAVKPLDLAMGI